MKIAMDKAEENTLKTVEELANLGITEPQLFTPIQKLLKVKFPEAMNNKIPRLKSLVLLKIYSILYKTGQKSIFNFKPDERIIKAHKQLTSHI